MKNKNNNIINSEVIKTISEGRVRTNILNGPEQKSIAFLVQRIPNWMSSDVLTFIGLLGNLTVFLSFLLAAFFDKYFLLLGLLGFTVSWFGDSLDGRIAYYRKIPRKWYGFALDFTTDWIGIVFIGLGFMIYIDQSWIFIGYAFIVLYGWEMITTILRYKVTGEYSIDSGLLGPTEVRIIISVVLVLEVLFAGSIIYCGLLINLGLLISNILDFSKLLKQANIRDQNEKLKLKGDA